MSSLDVLQCPTPDSLAPFYTAVSVGKGEEWLWCPNSGASTHMTPYDTCGNSTSANNRTTKNVVRNDARPPIKHLAMIALLLMASLYI